MANLTENTAYRAGIYQLETTDPILGGPPTLDVDGNPVPSSALHNAPLKQLADRTNYLKTGMDQLLEPAFAVIGGAFLRFESIVPANMDTLIDAGIYRTSSSTTNRPLTTAENLVMVTRVSNVVHQYVFGGSGTAFLVRSATLSGTTPTWGTWRDLGTPSGAIQAFARNTPPEGWLKANGAAVSRTTYARLFAAIGTTFGTGDGSTTFNVPDLRGEFVRGWDDGRGIDTARTFGSAQGQAIQAHTHSIPINEGIVDTSSAFSAFEGGNKNPVASETGSTGGAETRPRNVALLYCIKF
jgi:phage-related tail fiber protein